MTSLSQAAGMKFRIKGMDCASCATKIETAVGRLEGVSDVTVGLQTETLTVSMTSPEKGAAVEDTVRKLGYMIELQDKKKQPSSGGHGDGAAQGFDETHGVKYERGPADIALLCASQHGPPCVTYPALPTPPRPQRF